mgnify:CR=1 FL=1
MIYSLLVTLLVISGILFIFSVLFMSPKWGLGMWIAGMWWWGEYGSKKSLEVIEKIGKTLANGALEM